MMGSLIRRLVNTNFKYFLIIEKEMLMAATTQTETPTPKA